MICLIGMVPDLALVERFRHDLDAIVPAGEAIGVAVSGGADSLALLLLSVAARPERVEAATVDHGLRPESEAEAQHVARLCDRLGVPHAILTASWPGKPATAIQEQARRKRYRLLSFWAEERRLGALVTGHHADDQAETFLMRLARGSGVRGLAAMRARSITPGSHVRLGRPLLSWRRTELEEVCSKAGLEPIADPSNDDEQFERVRIRRALAGLSWLDAAAISKSAANCADADIALEWAVQKELKSSVHEKHGAITFRPGDVPAEIVRRVVAKLVRQLASEGDPDLRGRELDQLIEALALGGVATIRGVRCSGGRDWQFVRAPARREYLEGQSG